MFQQMSALPGGMSRDRQYRDNASFAGCFVFLNHHPRMRADNVFGRVCLSVHLSVCLSVCVSVCLSVQTITFEPFHTGTSFLIWRYILTISRSSLSIKVIGSRSRSHIKVKVTHQGQGHTSRSRSNWGHFKKRYSYAGGLHLNQMRSCFFFFILLIFLFH